MRGTSSREDVKLFKLAVLGTAVAIITATIVLLGEGHLKRSRPLDWPTLVGLPVAQQQRLVAAIVSEGNYGKCGAADGITIDGLDYGTVCRNNVAAKLAVEKKDPAYCQGLDDALVSRESCEQRALIASAKEANDPAACQRASSATVRQVCENEYWVDRAVRTGDAKFCEHLAPSDVVTCQEYIALRALVANPQPPYQCESFSEYWRYDCAAFAEAMTSGRSEPCRTITDPFVQTSCIQQTRKGL